MSDHKKKDCDGERRNLLLATSAVGGVAMVAAAVPFVASMAPSERAKAAGASVEVDISKLAPGEKMVVKWRGKPVWILHRTPEMLALLETAALKEKLKDPDSTVKPVQPKYASNAVRAQKKEYFVAIGICTHLGCSPTDKLKKGEMGPDWTGGFLCPCHGSLFDLAGRVLKGTLAETNLEIPPHMYLSDTVILIGEDSDNTKGA